MSTCRSLQCSADRWFSDKRLINSCLEGSYDGLFRLAVMFATKEMPEGECSYVSPRKGGGDSALFSKYRN